MSNLIARAKAFLEGNAEFESTGVRKNRTPVADRMRKIAKAAGVGGIVLLSACTTVESMGPKQVLGTVGGAVAGGVLGAQVGSGNGRLIATGAGVLIGGLLGGELGAALDRADNLHRQKAEQRAAEARVGHTVRWSNPESGTRGTIKPVSERVEADGRVCREYESTVTVRGHGTKKTYSTACQQPDGSWEVIARADTPGQANLAEADADLAIPAPPKLG